jgi:hypothetical protein
MQRSGDSDMVHLRRIGAKKVITSRKEISRPGQVFGAFVYENPMAGQQLNHAEMRIKPIFLLFSIPYHTNNHCSCRPSCYSPLLSVIFFCC